MSAQEVADAMGIHRRTVYRMVRREEFPERAMLRSARPVRFSRAAIEAWLDGRSLPAYAPISLDDDDDDDDE